LVVINDHLLGTLLVDSTGQYSLGRSAGALVAEPLTTLAARTRFRGRTPVPTGPAERGRYAPGSSQGLRLGALLSENGSLLVVTGGSQISSLAPGVATALGYDPAAAIRVKTADLSGLTRGAPITDTSRHPPGTYVSVTSGTTTNYFRVRNLDRVPVTKIGILGRGVAPEVVPALPGDLALPLVATGEDAPDGTIVRVAGGTLWYLAEGSRRKVVDLALFTAYGYDPAKAIVANHADISHLSLGSRIE
ncbi:MAG TPA: hypothetical protein VNT23_06015, partial [Gaiellaceae bacterium]|nr:hypothetical protein [Gaiellaceae bacterium]